MALNGAPALMDKIDILDAIKKSNGLVRHAAKKLGVSHQTLYTHMYRDPDIKSCVEECRIEYQYKQAQRYYEEDLDVVEEAYKAILSLVKGRNINAVMFVLKEKGGWDKGLKLQAQKQDQTLVFQVNNGQIEKADDSTSNTIPVLPKALPIEGAAGP